MYRYAFKDFDLVDTIVRKATRVGFAMPLKDGLFNVVRFTLVSSNSEIDRMRAAVLERLKRQPSQLNTLDKKL